MNTNSDRTRIWKKAKIINKYPQVQDSSFKDLEKGLSILKISKDEFNEPYLSADSIRLLLDEVFDLSSEAIGITRAFAKAGGKYKNKKPTLSKKNNDCTLYKLSHPGDIFLGTIWGSGLLKILYCKAGSQNEAYQTLKNLTQNLKGKELNMVDPYYGVNTLKVIEEMLRAGKKIKFLSSQTNENLTLIKREVNYLNKHYSKKLEVRIYPKKELHDRYILASTSFVIVGHGIKDIGNKESLLLVIDDAYARDIRKQLEKNFWTRWQDSSVKIL